VPTGKRLVSSDDVDAILDKIRPALLLDGGNVKLRSVEGVNILLEMKGSCRTCSSLPVTKRYGIELELRRHISMLGVVYWVDEVGGIF